jgi:hypothetical protein
MYQKYECVEDILGRAMVLSEILGTHLSDLKDYLRHHGVSDEKIDALEVLSKDIDSKYEKFMFAVDDIICTP